MHTVRRTAWQRATISSDEKSACAAVFLSFIMSLRRVLINGVTYIRSRDAAREVSLALDYVSRLARHGAVDGKRIAGIWFVDLISLKKFVADQERQKELLRARFARMRREEQRLAGHPSAFA